MMKGIPSHVFFGSPSWLRCLRLWVNELADEASRPRIQVGMVKGWNASLGDWLKYIFGYTLGEKKEAVHHCISLSTSNSDAAATGTGFTPGANLAACDTGFCQAFKALGPWILGSSWNGKPRWSRWMFLHVAVNAKPIKHANWQVDS